MEVNKSCEKFRGSGRNSRHINKVRGPRFESWCLGVTQPLDIPSKATRANKQQASFNLGHLIRGHLKLEFEHIWLNYGHFCS